MGTDTRNRVQIVVPADMDCLPDISDLAKRFVSSAGLSQRVSLNLAQATSKYLTRIVGRAAGGEVTMNLESEPGSARLELACKNIPVLPDTFSSMPVDEFVEANLFGIAKARLSVFEQGESKKANLSTGNNVHFRAIPEEDFAIACSLWREIYGSELLWGQLTSLGNMQSAVARDRLILLGAYDQAGELIGAFALVLYRNPLYVELLPPAVRKGATFWREGVDWLLKKARYIGPEWVLRYIEGNPAYIRTYLGTMYPVGLLHHHSLPKVMQVMGICLRPRKELINIPEVLAPDFEHICQSLALKCDMNTDIKFSAMGDKIGYIIKVQPSNRTALVRVNSYGNDKRLFNSWLTNTIKGLLHSKIATIYIDLPLKDQLTIIMGKNLIDAGFATSSLVPGGFLRFQKTIGKTPGFDINIVPETLRNIAITLDSAYKRT